MSFCDQTQQKTDQPQYFDPLGPVGLDSKGKPIFQPTGGTQQRAQVFQQLTKQAPQMYQAGQDAAHAMTAAAQNPGWAAAQDLANKTIRGDYLHGSPELDAAMTATRQAQMSAAGDADARTKSALARSGVGYGTAAQQASQANRGSAAARAGETEAGARLQDLIAERQLQAAAPNMLKTATETPLNYLQNVSGAMAAPLDQQAELTKGLAGGGSTATPNTTVYQVPGIMSQVDKFLGSL